MRFSIVIASLNGAKTLESALLSVFSQSLPDWEIIVQDGGSTDETPDILRRYEDRLSWRSEPDAGVYDAWNRALERVTGEWTLFLGTDDRLLHPHVLDQCAKHLAKLPESVMFAYGALLLGTDENMNEVLVLNRSLRNMYRQLLQDMGLPFPATFIRASLLPKRAFDASYAIAGDYDLAARLVTRSNVARLPVLVTFMRRGGISDCPEHREKLLAERERVLRTRIAPRRHELLKAIAEHAADTDTFLEDIPV